MVMQEILVYGGLAINLVGALLLMGYALKYGVALRRYKGQPIIADAISPKWLKHRAIAFGVMIFGVLIVFIATLIQ